MPKPDPKGELSALPIGQWLVFMTIRKMRARGARPRPSAIRRYINRVLRVRLARTQIWHALKELHQAGLVVPVNEWSVRLGRNVRCWAPTHKGDARLVFETRLARILATGEPPIAKDIRRRLHSQG